MYYGISGIKKAGIYPSFFYLIYSNDKHLFCLHYLHLFFHSGYFLLHIYIFFPHCFFRLSILRLYHNFLPLCFYSIIWKYLSASIIASLFSSVTCGTFALLSTLVMSNSDISNLTLISASGAFRDNKTHVSTCM